MCLRSERSSAVSLSGASSPLPHCERLDPEGGPSCSSPLTRQPPTDSSHPRTLCPSVFPGLLHLFTVRATLSTPVVSKPPRGCLSVWAPDLPGSSRRTLSQCPDCGPHRPVPFCTRTLTVWISVCVCACLSPVTSVTVRATSTRASTAPVTASSASSASRHSGTRPRAAHQHPRGPPS